MVSVVGINNGWYKVKYEGSVGYVRSDYLNISDGYTKNIADNQTPKAQAPATVTANNSPSRTTHADTGNTIVDFALDYLGYKYKYGGMSPSTGFDCSGFSSYVFKNFGIALTRNASGQYRDNGFSVNKSDMIPGDLVFFSSNGGRSVTHVGIYMGDNEFVHASTERTGVVVSRLDSTYYLNAWYGAKRVTG
jgi:cell wall-associated NlpC family hydrolase